MTYRPENPGYDYREVGGLVPTGVTATPNGLQDPGARRIARVSFFVVLPPDPAESVTLRLYRARRPALTYTNLAVPFVLNAGSFPGFFEVVNLDLIPGITLNPETDWLACSWQHSGPQALTPLNMNWETSRDPWTAAEIAAAEAVLTANPPPSEPGQGWNPSHDPHPDLLALV